MFENFRFESPEYLWWLVAGVVLALIRFITYFNQKKRLQKFGDPQLLKDMSARGELYRLLEPKIREGTDAERAAAARALTIGLAALEGQEIKDL